MSITERAMRYNETLDMLKAAGYQSIGRVRIDRYQTLAILTLAINQIAWLTNRVPFRIYQCLLVRLGEIARGVSASASRQAAGRARGHQDAEHLHVWCPCCGADLLAAGPLEPAEIIESKTKEAAMRGRSPQKSPHSRQNEAEDIPMRGKENAETGKVAGVMGTGGGDPTGGPLPSVLPHSPLT